MDFIATYWWVWLVGMILCYGIAMYNQIQRINRIQINPQDLLAKDWQNKREEFFKGVWIMALAALAGAGFMVMLLISIIANIIIYAKGVK